MSLVHRASQRTVYPSHPDVTRSPTSHRAAVRQPAGAGRCTGLRQRQDGGYPHPQPPGVVIGAAPLGRQPSGACNPRPHSPRAPDAGARTTQRPRSASGSCSSCVAVMVGQGAGLVNNERQRRLRRVGPRRADPPAGVPQGGRRGDDPDPGPQGLDRLECPGAGRRARRRRHAARAARRSRRSARRSARAGAISISADRRSALVTFSVPGDDDATQEAIVPHRARRQRRGGASSRPVRRPVRRRERRPRAVEGLRRRLPQRRDALAADHARDPAARVRLAGGRRHPAAARASAPSWRRSASSAVVSHVIPMDEEISSVVLLIGLAVGVDYSLFYLRREREERARGRVGGRGRGRRGGDLRSRDPRLRADRDRWRWPACSSPATARSSRSASAR